MSLRKNKKPFNVLEKRTNSFVFRQIFIIDSDTHALPQMAPKSQKENFGISSTFPTNFRLIKPKVLQQFFDSDFAKKRERKKVKRKFFYLNVEFAEKKRNKTNMTDFSFAFVLLTVQAV